MRSSSVDLSRRVCTAAYIAPGCYAYAVLQGEQRLKLAAYAGLGHGPFEAADQVSVRLSALLINSSTFVVPPA
jgi:hypothetical protein